MKGNAVAIADAFAVSTVAKGIDPTGIYAGLARYNENFDNAHPQLPPSVILAGSGTIGNIYGYAYSQAEGNGGGGTAVAYGAQNTRIYAGIPYKALGTIAQGNIGTVTFKAQGYAYGAGAGTYTATAVGARDTIVDAGYGVGSTTASAIGAVKSTATAAKGTGPLTTNVVGIANSSFLSGGSIASVYTPRARHF